MMSVKAYIAFQQRRIDMITQSELQIIKQATYSKDQIRPNEIKERQETFKFYLVHSVTSRRDSEKSIIEVIEREKVCRNQVIVYFEPSIENLEDFVDVHVQLAIMRNTQTGIELSLFQKKIKIPSLR